MAYTSIPDVKRAVGKPVTKDLIDNIHDNLEDINTRVNAISLSAGSNILYNGLHEKPKDTLPIGSIIYGSLTAAEVTAETDVGEWVAADGSSVSGSDWAVLTGRTTLPDIRGRFIRAKDNAAGNTAVDAALDSYTADSLKSHLHDMGHGHANTFSLTGTTTFASSSHTHSMTHEHKWGETDGATSLLRSYNSSGSLINVANLAFTTAGAQANMALSSASTSFYTKTVIGADSYTAFGTIPMTGVAGATASVGLSGAVTNMTGSTGSTGAAETAPRYVTENVFIKINRAYITTDTRLFVLRVAQQTTINNILVTPVSQGTSGSFQIDIKKGATPTTASQTIFQSGNLPTLAYNGAVGVTGLTDSAQNVVAAGQFIVVSVTATQAKLREVHIFIGGDY